MSGLDLNVSRIVSATERLVHRIEERFPQRQLPQIAQRLHRVALATAGRAAAIRQPHTLLRIGTGVLIAAIPFSLGAALWMVDLEVNVAGMHDAVSFFQTSIQSLVYIGIAIAFLTTLETKLKRTRAMDALHELRILAHLVDMHQLDKDPVYLLAREGKRTKSSPERGLDAFELNRYLDYCSEMLALIGKIAALYSQHVTDAVSLNASDQLEGLTTDLSRKIWQKVILLDRALVPG